MGTVFHIFTFGKVQPMAMNSIAIGNIKKTELCLVPTL